MPAPPSAASPDPEPVPRLELRGISKAYHWGLANDRIDLRVLPGEIHAILGENGAGKSTLMKIIYGAVEPGAGEMYWEGRRVPTGDPARTRALGIGMVFQHFSLFETLTVVENVSLAVPGDLTSLAARIDRLAQRYGMPLDPHRTVHALSVGERQRVEILRALMLQPRLLILDEPTSVLTPQAVDALFATLRQLAREGCSILYISHKLDEIQRLCHRVTILREGRVTGSVPAHPASAHDLARLMIGRDLEPAKRANVQGGGACVLSVRALRTDPSALDDTPLRDLTFDLRAGEILGIAGIAGNGQQGLLAALSGELPLAVADCVLLDGKPVAHLGVDARRGLGLCCIPEERLGRASVPDLPLTDNALLTAHRHGMVRHGWIRRRTARAFARRCIEALRVKAASEDEQARALSGGNLQKFIVAREILQAPRVLLVAQPTWGIDVGAAAEVRKRLLDLRARGAALLVISEDLQELFEISDRLAVMHRGRLSAVVPSHDTTPAQIGLWMAGIESPAASAAVQA